MEGEGEIEGSPAKHRRAHHRHKVHRHVEGHESEELVDSESESIGIPHSDESGEEGETCGCHAHGVGHHHIHGHHIHGHHGHGHHELHDGSGGEFCQNCIAGTFHDIISETVITLCINS